MEKILTLAPVIKPSDQKYLVMRRDERIVDEVPDFRGVLPHARRRGMWQLSQPPRGRVKQESIEQEEAVAVVMDQGPRTGHGVIGKVVAPAGDGGVVRRTAGEELGDVQASKVYEDSGKRTRVELRAQDGLGVDDGAPFLADASRHGEAALREAAENVRKHVVGKQIRVLAIPAPATGAAIHGGGGGGGGD